MCACEHDAIAWRLARGERARGGPLSLCRHSHRSTGAHALPSLLSQEEFVITIPDAEAEKILSAEDAITFVSTHPSAK